AKLPGVESTYAYAVYLMAGMLGWTLFNELLNRGLNLFIENAGLIKKMNFPRVTLPAIATASSLVSGAMLLLAMLLLFPLLGFGFSLAMLWLIPLIAVVTAFGLALGLLLGVINVFLRDLGQATPVVLQVWFWFTPIVYPLDILPEAYRNVIRFNPMCSAVNGFQRVLVYGEPPEMISLIYPAAFVAVLMPIAVLAFRRADEEMADLL
ncbi:MAG: ABC transporter permease, partial [Planctomycetota bacterium]